MYLPPQFKSLDLTNVCDLIKSHPFATLISNDDSGFPYITHLPLHLDIRPKDGNEPGLVLLGHVARPNLHWQYLRVRNLALVSFLGPHAYMSPTVYPELARVPTWNYLAVECKVRATLIEDPPSKDRLLKHLIADHEPSYAEQWRGLGEDFAQKMLAGIVAFELEVIDFQCKLKLNQHRAESHRAMRAIYANGNEDERELAQWMDRLGLDGSSKS